LLDESFSTALAGASRDFAESSGNTTFAFVLALALRISWVGATETVVPPLSDPQYYHATAQNLFEGRGYSVAVDERVLGLIAVADTIGPHSREAIRSRFQNPGIGRLVLVVRDEDRELATEVLDRELPGVAVIPSA